MKLILFNSHNLFNQLLGLQVGFKVSQNQEFFVVLQEVIIQGPAFADAARNRPVNQGVNRLLHDWVAFVEVTWVVGVVFILAKRPVSLTA